MARRPATPKIEEAPIEEASPADLVTPEDPGGRPVNASPPQKQVKGEPDSTGGENKPYDIVGEITRLHAYINSLHDVINALDQRVNDLEILKGQEILPVLFAGGGEPPDREASFFEEIDDDEDIPDFVNGVQQAFNRDSGDDTPWFNS